MAPAPDIPIDPQLLAKIGVLSPGAHKPDDGKMCAMEAVAYVAGEPWSDQPECASQVIGTFIRFWNDALPDDERNELLPPLIPRIVGTAGGAALERRHAFMAADWLVRVHTPAWLRLAKLNDQAAMLETLPEITSVAQVPSIRAPLEAVRKDAAAAEVAAREDAEVFARVAVGAAAGAAAWAAAGRPVWVAWAAGVAACGAACTAARDTLTPTRKALQQSAVALVERMIDAKEAS